MTHSKYDIHNICPVEKAGHLELRIRRWFQNPRAILRPYVRPGMTVLDLGCGPGFFTLEMAQMVGPSGRVVAVDLQQGRVDRLAAKVDQSTLKARLDARVCQPRDIGLSTRVDFALAFYLLHEVPDQRALFSQLRTALTPKGKVLVVEPPFHVSKKAFARMIDIAADVGLTSVARPRIFLSKAVVLQPACNGSKMTTNAANRGSEIESH